MAEYIKRKTLVDLVLGKLKYLGDARIMNKNDEKVLSEIDGYEKAIEAVLELILDNDLIENVQPVKRGKWVESGCNYNSEYDEFIIHAKCSCCNRWSYDIATIRRNVNNKYCAYCGARMEGDSECQ